MACKLLWRAVTEEDIMRQLSNLQLLTKNVSLRETVKAVGVALGLGVAVVMLSLKTDSGQARA